MHVIVVGGGAAGLLAAGMAAKRGHRVTIVERNPRMARKVMITGKGRCNVTNACSVQECVDNTPGNGRFLYSAFSAFPPQEVMAFFEGQGVPLKIERGNRVYPTSDKAVHIVDALVAFVKAQGCRLYTGRVTRLLLEDKRCVGVQLETGETLSADAVMVCTGGCSYPGTGSTGDGYTLAQQAGHTIVPPRPSLVGLETEESWCAELQGLSLKNCAIAVTDTTKGKTIYTDFGEMLFTHFGVSGPVILSASVHLHGLIPGRYRLSLDLKPALTAEQIDARLLREFDAAPNACLGNVLAELMPRSLVAVVLQLSRSAGEMKCHSVSRAQRLHIGEVLKNIPMTISGLRPFEEAVVTAGGVSTREVNATTMESKLINGLYFAGEVLDVDAYTGGFNLQIAFSTGFAAGNHV